MDASSPYRLAYRSKKIDFQITGQWNFDGFVIKTLLDVRGFTQCVLLSGLFGVLFEILLTDSVVY